MEKHMESAPRMIRGMVSLLDGLGGLLGLLVFVMTLTMTVVVVLRYAFDVGSIALQEVAAYIHGTIFTVGSGYTLLHDDHVRVDILYRDWSERTKAVVDVVGTVCLLFPLSGFIIWSSLDYVGSSWWHLEGSPEAGGLPAVFVLKSMIPTMGGLLVVAGIVRLWRCDRQLRATR